MCSASEDVQHESSPFSVQAKICSTSKAHLHYKRGCAVRIRHIISTREDVQYKVGRSSSFGTGGGGGTVLKNTLQLMNHYSN